MDEKRTLTENELWKIAELCSVECPIEPSLKKDMTNDVFHEIKRQSDNTFLYPSEIDNFIMLVVKEYKKALIQAGEPVGEQGAQSMGAPTTQMALNAFHAAGKISRMTTGGLPRMIELTNCSKSKDIKNPSCTIYFEKKYNTVSEIPLHMILETRISHLKQDYDIFPYNPAEVPWWYKMFQCLYGKVTFSDWYLRLYLDKNEMYRRKVTPYDLAEIIEDKIAPVACLYSPVEQSIIDIFIDTSLIAQPDDVNLEMLDEPILIRRLIRDYILPQISDFFVKGVKDIKQVYPLKDHSGEYFVETDGSNLKDVLQLDFVSQEKTISNRPLEIFEIFGILGLEQYYRKEFENIFSQSASYVNPAWIDLIVHHICHTGKPVPANRFGHMKKPEVSTFTKATFEEMTVHLIRAGIFGYDDPLDSIAGRIVAGKRCKHGTGMVDVIVDPDEIVDLEYLPQNYLMEDSVQVDIKKQKPPSAPTIKDGDDEDDDSDKLSDDGSGVDSDDDEDFVLEDNYDDDDDDDFVDF